MVVVPATLALGLGLGILIGAELPTGHPADWTSGWQWAQQHWSTYLADPGDTGLASPSAIPSDFSSGPMSMTPVTRNARPKARRRTASVRQAGTGCTFAPRPGSLRVGSGTILNFSVSYPRATTRSNSEAGARIRQPIHIRIGFARRTTRKSTPTVSSPPRQPLQHDRLTVRHLSEYRSAIQSAYERNDG